jgi:hypothetical protein
MKWQHSFMKEKVLTDLRKIINFYFVTAMTVYNLHWQLCKDYPLIVLHTRMAWHKNYTYNHYSWSLYCLDIQLVQPVHTCRLRIICCIWYFPVVLEDTKNVSMVHCLYQCTTASLFARSLLIVSLITANIWFCTTPEIVDQHERDGFSETFNTLIGIISHTISIYQNSWWNNRLVWGAQRSNI